MIQIGGQGPQGVTGEIRMFAGAIADIPSDWLFCDGSAVSRTTYARLFSLLGTQYGVGDGVTTFNLPDCRNLVPVGAKQDVAGVAKSDANGDATLAKTRTSNNRRYATSTGQYSSGSINTVWTVEKMNGIDAASSAPGAATPSYPNYISFAFIIKT